jgi:hypothetical protein
MYHYRRPERGFSVYRENLTRGVDECSLELAKQTASASPTSVQVTFRACQQRYFIYRALNNDEEEKPDLATQPSVLETHVHERHDSYRPRALFQVSPHNYSALRLHICGHVGWPGW